MRKLTLDTKLPRIIITLVLLVISRVAFAQVPQITGFSPLTICQGDSVVITGSNLNNASKVAIGATPADKFVVKNSTTIVAYTSKQANTGFIIVTTPGGTDTSNTKININPAPIPALYDVSTAGDQFTNCNGSFTYDLSVKNISTPVASQSGYDIDWGDKTDHFLVQDWPVNAVKTHTYTAQGYYKIILKITPLNGCMRTVTYNFYNGANPLASLTTTTPTTGLCAPATISFKIGNWFNNSAGTIYRLEFGDDHDTVLTHPLNAANTDQVVSYTYTTTSCPYSPFFKATLNVTNKCLPTNYTLDQIVIRRRPTANFGYDTVVVCINDPVC